MKTTSPKEFVKGKGYPEGDIYVFPFQAMDSRRDGSSLGRIMWQVEPIFGKKTKGRYYVEKLLVWAKQTRDERYAGKVFEIPCYSESITGDSLERESFLNYVWQVQQCEVHKGMVFSAYPANEHKELIINVGSSISIDIDLK